MTSAIATDRLLISSMDRTSPCSGTVTAPDYRPVLKEMPRVNVESGVTLHLVLLAADSRHCAGIDVESGTLVRAWATFPFGVRFSPYDVVEVTLGGDDDADALPDPAQPEAVAIQTPPEVVDRLTGRRCERMLKALLHPKDRPLLNNSSTAIPFWERRDDHPSIAVVDPGDPVVLVRQGSYLGARFEWQGHVRELPCLDRSFAGEMDRSGMQRTRAPKGSRLLVAFTPPIDGRCHKVVESILPRP